MNMLLWVAVVFAAVTQVTLAADKFSCEGRASGYYADVGSGCQVYHMCDGLGRQFSYSCPNTTLFQQRMLICDHWYMVNCSKSELDYKANLLIGQRDKPFVEDSSEHPYHRTPRPDLLTHQPFRQGKSQSRTVQNLVGVETDEENANGNHSTDRPQYFLPSHWSTEYSKGVTTPIPLKTKDLKGQKPLFPFSKNPVGDNKVSSTFDPKQYKTTKNTPTNKFNTDSKDFGDGGPSKITLPPLRRKDFGSNSSSRITLPPFVASPGGRVTQVVSTERTRVVKSSTPTNAFFNTGSLQPDFSNPGSVLETDLLPPFPSNPVTNNNGQLVSQNNNQSPVFPSNFKATVPTYPAVVPLKSVVPNPTIAPLVPIISTSKTVVNNVQPSSFEIPQEPAVTNTPQTSQAISSTSKPVVTNEIEPPSRFYQPPKLTSTFSVESTTMDPQTFYKVLPSKDLEPPKLKDRFDNGPVVLSTTTLRSVTKKDTSFGETTLGENKAIGEKRWKELRQMFFIPEYDFPLETGARPSYEGGLSSFQVNPAPPNPERFKEAQSTNAECPKCDPAFLIPGTCKPCLMIRR